MNISAARLTPQVISCQVQPTQLTSTSRFSMLQRSDNKSLKPCIYRRTSQSGTSFRISCFNYLRASKMYMFASTGLNGKC